MAHITTHRSYLKLSQRVNRFPQGAPPDELLYKILSLLFSEKEAGLAALLPIKPFSAKKASQLWKIRETEAITILENLSDRGILLDIERDNGSRLYLLPPPMAGFFEFSMMRIRGDINQKLLSELFYEYMNVEEEFIKQLFTNGETQLGRIFVQENSLDTDAILTILDYERASDIIKTSAHIGIGMCYCRHKMAHLDRACDAPMEICMTFNNAASSLIRHGISRRTDKIEGLDLLDEAYGRNLVQFGENVRDGVNFICNCCGCCCEAMLAAKRFAFLHPVHTSNYLPVVENCTGCGKCQAVCPVGAINLISADETSFSGKKKAQIDKDICLGCGICVRNCPNNFIRLERRSERIITPVNSAHRVVLMAIERGKLQNLIFDNQALFSHRAMAAILGVILKLPPIKQVLANRQLKSRYLESLFSKVKI